MADDRRQSYQSTSPRERRAWWKSGHGTHKRGLNTKIHLAVDAHGMPIRFFVTAGTIADCTQACALIDGVSAEYLLADRGYDSRRVIEKALRAGTNVVIPPRKNRKEQRDYDRYLYKLRHLVEKCVSPPETLARYRDAVRKTHLFIRRSSANSMHCSLGKYVDLTIVDSI